MKHIIKAWKINGIKYSLSPETICNLMDWFMLWKVINQLSKDYFLKYYPKTKGDFTIEFQPYGEGNHVLMSIKNDGEVL